MRTHWAIDYVGKPYKPGARGPDSFDCWGLVRDIYEKRFGIALPEWIGLTPHNTPEFPVTRAIVEEWRPELNPFEGCVVAMSQTVAFHHVGIYLEQNGGKVIHAWSPSGGVVVNTLRELKIAFSFRNIKYYRHRSWPTS